ncbi:MAG: hypothetical protein F6J93_23950 [Oscillatoria sp. SIO1A7]|nr:hypothetical protein [Oscillatoria sp. SIO1A7]
MGRAQERKSGIGRSPSLPRSPGPHTPNTPNTPHTPNTPNTPHTPQSPHTPHTPQSPHTLSVPAAPLPPSSSAEAATRVMLVKVRPWRDRFSSNNGN